MWLNCIVAGYSRRVDHRVASRLSGLYAHIRKPPSLHHHFTSLSLISVHLWSCAVFIWAWACALVISAMEVPSAINSVQDRAFNDLRNCSAQATPFTSRPMTDMLRGSLCESRYSDTSSNRYHRNQSGHGYGEYMNERNSTFEAEPELSLPSPPL